MSYTCVNRPDRKADVLMTLHDADDWMTVNEIAEEINAINGTVRTVTQRLEDDGRIESRPDVRFPHRKVFRI